MTTITSELTEEQYKMYVEYELRSFYGAIIKPESLARYVFFFFTTIVVFIFTYLFFFFFVFRCLRLSIVTSGFNPILSKFELFKKTLLSEFNEFAQRFLNEIKIKSLLQGNLNSDTAKNILEKIINTLNCKQIKDVSFI